MIIAIGGGMCAGKSTMCDLLQKHLTKPGTMVRVKNFADKLKAIDADLFGHGPKNRGRLQKIGLFMRGINPDVWVDVVKWQYDEDLEGCINMGWDLIYLVGDVRYENEIQFIREHGPSVYLDVPLQIRIDRHVATHGYAPTEEHLKDPSEQLSSDRFDYIVPYGDLTWDFKTIPVGLLNEIARWREYQRGVHGHGHDAGDYKQIK